MSFGIAGGLAFKDDNLAGLNLGYSSSTQTNFNNPIYYQHSHSNAYNADLFYRRYKKIVKDFYFFVQIDAGLTVQKETGNDSSSVSQATVTSLQAGLSLSPGLSYRLCKHLYLDLELDGIVEAEYANENDTEEGTGSLKQNTFGLSTSLGGNALNSLNAGISFIF